MFTNVSTKRSNNAYVIESMLEYFIAIAVGATYLTHVMNYIGIPSSLQGIINAIISLGCGFQILAILFPLNSNVERKIIILHTISQILFAFVFFVPLLNFPFKIKVVALILSFVPAHIIHNYINSPKISWCMSHVDDSIRGKFTANKEIVSLLGGMTFSLTLGAIIDKLEVSDKMELAFTIIGGIVIACCLAHTLSLVFVDKEKTNESKHKVSLKTLFSNKNLMKTLPIFIVWDIAHYITVSFAYAYQSNTLGFSPLTMTLFTIGGSLLRALLSRPFGKFADKYSFAKMLFVCFISHSLGFAVLTFTVPSIGLVGYILYTVFSYVGSIGIASSQINLIYDQVKAEERSSAFALSRTFSGFAGFFIVLIISPLYEFIGDNGLALTPNFTLYPLPAMAMISFTITVLLLVYMYFVFFKKKKTTTLK
ncbi:MAG: MFS transporter [Clostridia bacterium]|nr:MFS transporter [Clostridia bacterium]